MKIQFLFLSLLLLLGSCSGDEDTDCANCDFDCLDGTEENVYTNDCIDDWECSFELFDESALLIEDNYSVVDGDKQVFVVRAHTDGVLQIADDELTHNLVFEIERESTGFNLVGEEMKTINLQYQQVCFCENWMFNEVSMGCIQGQKSDEGKWLIQGNIIVMETNLEANFLFEAEF